MLCAICVFYCCVNNARSLRLLVKPLRQWYALPLLLLTVTLVMRALFLVALLLPFSFLSATSVIRTVFVVVFSFLVCFFYYRYASNLCQSNTCPLWQVFDWLYDSDSNQTLAPFGKCIESLWKFSGIYFLMVELFLPVLSPILHIVKEIFLHHNQEQIATRYDGFDVPLGDTVVIRMVFHFVWQQLQENFSLSVVKMAITYFLKCSGVTYHVSDALC